MKISSVKSRAVSHNGKIMLNAFRSIVQALRQASINSEKLYGLSAAQMFVLRTVAEQPEPMTIKQLAEATGTHQSSVSVVVKKLAQQHLLQSRPAPQDARARGISLTQTGHEQLRSLPPLIQDRFLAGLEKMSTSDRQALISGLQAFLAAAELETSPVLFFEEPA